MTQQDGDKVVATQEYDEMGQLIVTATADGARTTYRYDSFGRLSVVERNGLPSLSYERDAVDRVTAVRIGEKVRIEYAFDYLGRLAAVRTPAGDVTYEYDSGNRRTIRRSPGGAFSVRTQGPSGALVSIEHGAAGGRIVSKLNYEYRPDGLVGSIMEVDGQAQKKHSFGYDLLKRLTSVIDEKGEGPKYEYDAVGNRTKATGIAGSVVTMKYDWTGAVVEIDGKNSDHDAAGNMLSYSRSGVGGTMAYTRDGRLESVRKGDTTITYAYDGDGCLRSRTASGQKVEFVVDPLVDYFRPLAALLSNGRMVLYLWEPDSPVLLGVLSEDGPRFFLHDHLESVRGVVDKDGRLLERRQHDVFGVPLGGQSTGLEPWFAGMFYDADAGLYLTHLRAYDPALGRFLQRDPEHVVPNATGDHLSAYAYAHGDPVNWVDRDGAQPKGSDGLGHPNPYSTERIHVEVNGELYQIRVHSIQKAPMHLRHHPKNDVNDPNYDKTPSKTKRDNTKRHDMTNEYRAKRSGAFVIREMHANPFHNKTGYSRADRVAYNENKRIPLREAHFGANEQQLRQKYAGAEIRAKVIDVFETDSHIRGILTDRQMEVRQKLLKNIRANPEKFVKDVFKYRDRDKGGGGAGGSKGRGGSPATPSKVGGVALSGAGRLLEGIGAIQGITIGSNGQIVLLSPEATTSPIPPLRIDDVVTVFRAIYELGESPSVSIDPDPQNPHGPTFNVRYGAGTEDTYVGWVLFEADRRMKGYTLGQDNETREVVRSKIPGYDDVLKQDLKPVEVEEAAESEPQANEDTKDDNGGGDKPSDGNDSPRKEERRPPKKTAAKGQNWERFWIVPSSIVQKRNEAGTMTLFDIALKVDTEVDDFREGMMEATRGKRPSSFASSFASWFTNNYDAIGAESRARLPQGHGLPFDEVNVFEELRRITLLTAVAERMRDRGETLPSWMRNYPTIKPFPAPKTTKSIIAKARYHAGHAFYGGVTLAPPSAVVQEKPATEVEARIAAEAQRTLGSTDAPTVLPVKTEAGAYRAASLPGGETRALGANHLEENDVAVFDSEGRGVRLDRAYHSFFQPKGEFGGGWTMDLPELHKRRAHFTRKENQATYRPVFELISPHDTAAAWFDEQKPFPELGVVLLAPREEGELLGLEPAREEGGRSKVWTAGGGKWTFDVDGFLVESTDGPETITYERDDKHRVSAIRGSYGGKALGEIVLHYDAEGRISAAKANSGEQATYTYDNDGRLAAVERRDGRVEYKYDGLLLKQQIMGGKIAFEYEYEAGRLKQTRRLLEDGQTSAESYRIERKGETTQVAIGEAGAAGNTVSYDSALRPVSIQSNDGAKVEWKYGPDGIELRERTADGVESTCRSTTDRSFEKCELPGGGTTQARYDKAGHLTQMQFGDQVAYTAEWSSDGKLRSEKSLGTEIEKGISKDSQRPMITIKPSTAQAGRGWMQVDLDEQDRVHRVRDATGAEAGWAYGSKGQIEKLTSKGAEVRFADDDQGRLKTVQTSWGMRVELGYDAAGEINRVEQKASDKTSTAEFVSGRLARFVDYDGGETSIKYEGQSEGLAPTEIQLPNKILVKFEHSATGHPARAVVGSLYSIEYTFDSEGRMSRLRFLPIQKSLSFNRNDLLVLAFFGGLATFGFILNAIAKRNARKTQARPAVRVRKQ